MAKTHCKNGHPRTPDNLDKWNNCRICRAAYFKQYAIDHPKPRKGKGGGNSRSGNRLKPERIELLKSCVLDGWPLREIKLTHGFDYGTIKKYHPDYRGITLQESGSLSFAKRKANRKWAA